MQEHISSSINTWSINTAKLIVSSIMTAHYLIIMRMTKNVFIWMVSWISIKLLHQHKEILNIHDAPPGINILEVFDEMDCQLEELSISNCQDDMLQYLTQSNQSRCFQKLTLKWTDISSIHCINSMEALTTLKLKFSSLNHLPIPNLADCLNACSSTLKNSRLLA